LGGGGCGGVGGGTANLALGAPQNGQLGRLLPYHLPQFRHNLSFTPGGGGGVALGGGGSIAIKLTFLTLNLYIIYSNYEKPCL
jgi:hypothetical protein